MPKVKGFTLIELLVAITVVAILSAIGFASYNNAQVFARDSRRKADLRSLQNALELYHQQNSRYPFSNSTWQLDNTKDGGGNCIFSTDPWIIDQTNPNPIALDSTYINSMPHDPKSNNSNCGNPINSTANSQLFGYAYRSGSSNGTNCSGDTNSNQNYLLITTLENNKDQETNTFKSYTDCNNTAIASSNPTLFVVKNP